MTSNRILLDVHAHLIPLRPQDTEGVAGVSWNAAGRLVVDGGELPNPQVYDAQALLAWMDRHGVASTWISAPPTLYRAQLEEAAAQDWARRLNRALDAVVQQHPQRLACLHHLPMQHPAAAARLVQESGERFAMPCGDPAGVRLLSEPAYEPLWQALDAKGAFLFLHPGRACDRRFSHFSLMNLLGGPTETALAAAHLAMAGIAERRPRIRFCLAHGGGTLPAAAGRIQRGQETEREGAYLGGEKIRQALRRFHADCITHDAAALQLAAATFGEERILFGSDWPFGMGLPEPHGALADTPAALRQRIFEANPRALLDAAKGGA
ncbi:MAG TPA: amidohydrolase family protein [Ramlibacter sp.]|nr:amidohydrolase family protein [Ramlibacter sp.]